MNNCPPEYLALAAYIMRVFPEREDEMLECESEIAALCHAPSIVEPNATSQLFCSSEPERILEAKERHVRYNILSRFVNTVRTALSRLNDSELEIISLTYWQGKTNRETSKILHKDERWIQRLRIKALRVTVPLFVAQDIFLSDFDSRAHVSTHAPTNGATHLITIIHKLTTPPAGG
jgi:hypothetical protein